MPVNRFVVFNYFFSLSLFDVVVNFTAFETSTTDLVE